jgi:hypothetical protein
LVLLLGRLNWMMVEQRISMVLNNRDPFTDQFLDVLDQWFLFRITK